MAEQAPCFCQNPRCGKPLPAARRLKTFCSYACRGQLEAHKATADHSGLVCSKNTRQNKALQSLKRQSVGAVTFARINRITIRVDCSRKKGAAWLLDVAWPGASRQRWLVRVGDRGSEPLLLDAAKRTAGACLRERSSVRPRDWTAKLNRMAADEVDRASLQQERRRWPIDLMNGKRRGLVEERGAIIETELARPSEDGPALQGDECPLDYYAEGYPKLPECLRRSIEQERFKMQRPVPVQRDENLDVVRTSHGQESLEPERPLRVIPLLIRTYLLCALSRHRHHSVGSGRVVAGIAPLGSKYILPSQAINLIEAVKYAKSIDLPLVAHLTIHWSGTFAFDDHDGSRFAKVREGVAKVLVRRRIPPAWAWCRECKAHPDIVHSHLLFHLPVEYRSGLKLAEMEAHQKRLVDRHGDGMSSERAVELATLGGIRTASISSRVGPSVWKLFPRIRKEWRTAQGVIHGKRCGVTRNLGRAARNRVLINREDRLERIMAENSGAI